MYENCLCLFYMAERDDVRRHAIPKECISTKQKVDPGYVRLHGRREALHKANSYNKVSVTSGNRLEWNDRRTGSIKSNDTEDALSDEISWGTNFIPTNAKHGTVWRKDYVTKHFAVHFSHSFRFSFTFFLRKPPTSFALYLFYACPNRLFIFCIFLYFLQLFISFFHSFWVLGEFSWSHGPDSFGGHRPLHWWGSLITDTTHSVGLLWTSDRLVAQTSLPSKRQHSQEPGIHGHEAGTPSRRGYVVPMRMMV